MTKVVASGVAKEHLGNNRGIGFSLGPLLSIQELLSFSKLADSQAISRAGSNTLDSIWVPESWGREAFSTLGAISQVTNKLKLGTSIVNIFSRTPATVAMAATTLDMLSKNRTVIGLGSSTPAIVQGWHGTKFNKPIQRMKEYVELVRLMSSGDRVSYFGEFYQVDNFKILHKPHRSHIPIYVAAINKRMVALATEIADGIMLYLRPLHELEKTIPKLRERTKKKQFEIACSFICAVSNTDPQKARGRAAKTLAFYVAVGKYYSKFLSENGFRSEVQKIKDAYSSKGGDFAASQVTEKMLDSLVIAGNSEQCRKLLGKFTSAGVTRPILQVNPVGDSESSFRELLSTFR